MDTEVLQAIWDIMADAIIVADEHGKVVFANAAGRRIHDLAAPIREWPERYGLYYPDRVTVYPPDELPLMRAIRGESIESAEVYVFPEDASEGRWTVVSAKPLRDGKGRQTGAFVVIHDTTELKRAQEALKKERDWVSGILNTSAALIAAFDQAGLVVHFNRACEQLTGYSFAEVQGRAIWDMVLPAGEVEAAKSIFESIAAGQCPKQSENHWISADGTRRLISWSNSVLLNPEGAVEFVIATGVDVSEQRRLEARLRQAQKLEAVGTLAGGIAHDFNNLLTVISGYNHMVLDELPPDNPTRPAAQEVAKAAERAAALTNQLLSFSRRQITQPKVLDLNLLVQNVEKMLHRVIGEDVELVAALAPDLQKVKADPGSLEQIIMNLAVNSRDAMPEGGRLVIETANAGADQVAATGIRPEAASYVMLSVSDTGCGMDSDTQSRIFEPFFTTKEQGRGTGLGLATVYAMVTQSGGTIAVDSKPAEGTTFRIYFPAVEEAGEGREEAGAAERSLRGTETILLVEDEAGVRKLVQMTLEQRGYNVLEASNGWEALQLQEQHQGPIQLLITDIVVPQMNGQELAARLGLLRPDTRILYMSGYTDKAIILEGVLSSGTAFIKKPFTPDALSAKVREVLDSQKTKHA